MEKIDQGNKRIIKLFILNKLILFIVSIIAITFFVTCNQAWHISDDPFLNAWAQWDGFTYLWIAQNGYETDPEILGDATINNFLPLYPILIKILGILFLNNFVFAGFLISNITSFIFVFFMYRLFLIDFEEKIAYRSVLFILFFPTAYFFSALYAESVFLTMVVISFFYARKSEWFKSSLMGMLLPITRIVGFGFFIPIIFEYFRQKKFKFSNIDKKIFYLLILFVGIFIYFIFSLNVNGTLFGYIDRQNANEFAPALPYVSILYQINNTNLESIGSILYSSWNLFVVALFSFLIIYSIYKKIDFSYIIYMLIIFVIPLMSSRLIAISRYTLLMFPAFLALSILSYNKKYGKLVFFLYAVFFLMLIVLTARFVLVVPGNMISCVDF